jgi:uncharacterized protein YndB with AHSA1/START domain
LEQAYRSRRKVTFERTFDASVEEVWEMWTTAKGIESWWGPDGFEVEVEKLELRLGGELLYTMTATATDQIDFLKKAGMPLAQKARVRFTEIDPPRHLTFRQLADFIPGVDAYEIETTVDLEGGPEETRMVMTTDVMHDERWTELAVMGWESELGRLATALGKRNTKTE